MKAKIVDVIVIDNATSQIKLQIVADNGDIVFEGSRGFTSTSSDVNDVLAELKKSFQNIRDSELQKKESKLSNQASLLLGKEVDLD